MIELLKYNETKLKIEFVWKKTAEVHFLLSRTDRSKACNVNLKSWNVYSIDVWFTTNVRKKTAAPDIQTGSWTKRNLSWIEYMWSNFFGRKKRAMKKVKCYIGGILVDLIEPIDIVVIQKWKVSVEWNDECNIWIQLESYQLAS